MAARARTRSLLAVRGMQHGLNALHAFDEQPQRRAALQLNLRSVRKQNLGRRDILLASAAVLLPLLILLLNRINILRIRSYFHQSIALHAHALLPRCT